MRYEQNQKKKKGKWRSVLMIVLVLLIAGTGYSYYQYKQGVNQSLKKVSKANKVVYTFDGKKDQFGDTNILLMGSDARGNEVSRADTIMIAHYNENKGTYKLTSIMRDSYVDIPGYGKHKINSAFARGGPDLMRKTIKENFGIDLQYYAIVHFQGFVQLIDEAFPNGVKIDVEKAMSKNIGVSLKPGVQRLNGKEMLGYVRFRHDAIGDFGRVRRQQQAVKAIGEQLTSLNTIPKIPKLIGVITPYINTNMNTSDIIFMTTNYFSKRKSPVETLRIPVDNSYTNQRVYGEGAVLAIDVAKNREALQQFITK
ncbi:LCP family protein [Neobacillus niacini]|uniref:LCP family protein n=1 Tax=Neobacillus niacini TaxID=86668 RepID=UPI002866443E|nr:LCP family protein [Neobacillus niacini]MDR7001353.1 LCP family protein required for cell wall assembly [Neobacillus niacini]